MRNSVIRRIAALILALVMLLSLCITAFAKEQVRIKINVESEADIAAFFNSEEYDPEILYSFIIMNSVQPMALCPDCGKNNYRGYTEHREMDIHPRMCPAYPDFGNDLCTEFDVYSYSECDYCGYRTRAVFVNRYWEVACHVEMPDGWGTYIARPGQSYRDGYDFHEDPDYMGLT